MTNEYSSIRINNDYSESRRDNNRDVNQNRGQNKTKIDPNFVKAMQGFIKKPKKIKK